MKISLFVYWPCIFMVSIFSCAYRMEKDRPSHFSNSWKSEIESYALQNCGSIDLFKPFSEILVDRNVINKIDSVLEVDLRTAGVEKVFIRGHALGASRTVVMFVTSKQVIQVYFCEEKSGSPFYHAYTKPNKTKGLEFGCIKFGDSQELGVLYKLNKYQWEVAALYIY